MKEMSDRINQGFVGYEYREISVPEYLSSLCADSYPYFGWRLDGNPAQSKNRHSKSPYVDLRFKRDRKIMNKTELTRLQRNFDGCVDQLEALEKAKTFMPFVIAVIVGLIGTVFMALSTFAITADPPHVVVCVAFAVPGITGWILPFFIYRKMVLEKIKKLTPLIEQKYDEIYEICEKGSGLLK